MNEFVQQSLDAIGIKAIGTAGFIGLWLVLPRLFGL
jgi:hypothetical protein